MYLKKVSALKLLKQMKSGLRITECLKLNFDEIGKSINLTNANMKKTALTAIVLITLFSAGCSRDPGRYRVSNSPFIIDIKTGDLWYYDMDSLHSKRNRDSNWIYLGHPPSKR